MNRRIALTTLVVADYDEAIAWYTGKLGFALLEDIDQGHKRWVVVGPTDGSAAALLLAPGARRCARAAAVPAPAAPRAGGCRPPGSGG